MDFQNSGKKITLLNKYLLKIQTEIACLNEKVMLLRTNTLFKNILLMRKKVGIWVNNLFLKIQEIME